MGILRAGVETASWRSTLSSNLRRLGTGGDVDNGSIGPAPAQVVEQPLFALSGGAETG